MEDKAAKSASAKDRQFASDTNVINRARDDTKYQRAAADAKAAGLHPLFALGAGGAGGGSPAMSVGSSPSGSHLGGGISRAAAQIGSRMTGADERALHAAQEQRSQESHTMDMAQEQLRLSALKRAEQKAISGIDVWEPGQGDVAITHPIGTQLGVPLDKRPLSSTGRRSVPMWMETMTKDGPSRVLNPDMGMDEVGQVEFLRQQAEEWASRLLTKGRKSMKSRHKKQRQKSRRIMRRSDSDFIGGS